MSHAFYTLYLAPLNPLALSCDELAELGTMAWKKLDAALPTFLESHKTIDPGMENEWQEPWLEMCEDDLGLALLDDGRHAYGISFFTSVESESAPIPPVLLRALEMVVRAEMSRAANAKGLKDVVFEVVKVDHQRKVELSTTTTAPVMAELAQVPSDEAMWVASSEDQVVGVFLHRGEAFKSSNDFLDACDASGKHCRRYRLVFPDGEPSRYEADAETPAPTEG